MEFFSRSSGFRHFADFFGQLHCLHIISHLQLSIISRDFHQIVLVLFYFEVVFVDFIVKHFDFVGKFRRGRHNWRLIVRRLQWGEYRIVLTG